MICPYSESGSAHDVITDRVRCLCGRYVKRCAHCGASSRAFAGYCRECGKPLSPDAGSWTAYKGGSRRLGVNRSSPGTECLTRAADLRIRLGDTCRSLLGYDGHVVAISINGIVDIADPMQGKSMCRFQAAGPITAEPCIENGILYLATRGQVTAYALAAMTLETPRIRPLWSVPFNGTPIHALTALAGRIYVTAALRDRRELLVIEHATARVIHSAREIGWVAADPERERAVFFSEDDERVRLHVVDGVMTTYIVSLRTLAPQPIALLGETVFAIFDDGHRLYRIDLSSGAIEEALEEDTQFFALTAHGDEWDRHGVRVDNHGIEFSGSGVRDSFAPHERVTKGSPVIVQNCMVAVGMEDGRVLLYNLAQLPRHEVWRLQEHGSAPITAIASFDSYIVAGNQEGIVEVRELLPKGAAW